MTFALLVKLLVVVIPLLGGLFAWYINPKRKAKARLEQIEKEMDSLLKMRDVALEKNDTDCLTYISATAVRLSAEKSRLLQLV